MQSTAIIGRKAPHLDLERISLDSELQLWGEGFRVGFLKMLGNLFSPEGVREAMRMAYKRHYRTGHRHAVVESVQDNHQPPKGSEESDGH